MQVRNNIYTLGMMVLVRQCYWGQKVVFTDLCKKVIKCVRMMAGDLGRNTQQFFYRPPVKAKILKDLKRNVNASKQNKNSKKKRRKPKKVTLFLK